MNKFSDMTMNELTDAYNAMANSPSGQRLGPPRNRNVSRFSDREVGIKRCQQLAESIRLSDAAHSDPNLAHSLEQSQALSATAGEPAKQDKPAKAKAEKPVKAAKPVKAKAEKPAKGAKAERSDLDPIAAAFGTRAGTVREKVIVLLAKNYGSHVALKKILKEAYGTDSEDNAGALGMVLKGVRVMIEKNKLKHELRTNKEDKSIGLFKAD